MTHVTCWLTAKNRYQLRNPTLGNRVWTILGGLMFIINMRAPARLSSRIASMYSGLELVTSQ